MITKILKFSAPWCGQCRALQRNLQPIQDKITEINIEDNDELVSEYNIRSIPVLVFLDENDSEVDRIIGNTSLDNVNAILNKRS